MKKPFLYLSFLAFFNACTTPQNKTREISSEKALPRVNWQFSSANFKFNSFVYTPFFTHGDRMIFYSGGGGTAAGNGIVEFSTDIANRSNLGEKKIITTGPDDKNYNYFRAPRVAKSGSEMWMLVEVSGCYTGCDSTQFPKSLAVYKSANEGNDWIFLDYVKLDGKRYNANWWGHTGLVYNPEGSSTLDINNPTKNRFVTVGENKDIMVSADGIDYKSIPMKQPFPNDRLTFASLVKTPFGYHMTTCANWSDNYFTTTVRHLFSKDLINWISIEANSFLKNPKFYKGIHLSYDEKTNKLWAFSPCGSDEACGFLAWVEPIDYSISETPPPTDPDDVPIGEFVFVKNGTTALILEKTQKINSSIYKLRLANGTIDSGYTKKMMTFPLASYRRDGCIDDSGGRLCVGDTILINSEYASVMGIYEKDPAKIKFAFRFSTGVVGTNYTREMFTRP